ncbi:uncharacterized protein [Misgurnus anguillicaudatus]|uniref:uncharacterized protein isoform X2 n=1 Tax=Misgurnus anguillicaudatus TaxID=75329 RepID=UPI003CCF76B3
MEVDGSSSQPSPPYGLATPVAPPQPLPPSSLQNITDALKDMKVEDSSLSQPSPSHGSSAAVAPPPAGVLSFPPPAPPQPPPSSSQQNNTDAVENMEVEDGSSSQHSPPHGLSAAVAPPQPHTPPPAGVLSSPPPAPAPRPPAAFAPPLPRAPLSSLQNIADALQDMKLEDRSSSQLSPPQDQRPPLAPPSLPPSRKRRAPSPLQQNNGVRDEMEPKPKKARLFGPLDEVTPPQAQTSSQQNKADAGEVDSSSVSHQPIQQVPPPVSPPQRPCLKRPAACTAQVDLYQSSEQNKFD